MDTGNFGTGKDVIWLYNYFKDVETEVQRGEATGTKSDSYTMTEVKIKPKSSNPWWKVPIQAKVVNVQSSTQVLQTHLLHSQLSLDTILRKARQPPTGLLHLTLASSEPFSTQQLEESSQNTNHTLA